MTVQEEMAKALTGFFDAYFVKRSINETLDYLMEDIKWIGTGKHEIVHNKIDAQKALETELAVDPDPYGYTCADLSISVICPQSGVAMTDMCITKKKENVMIEARITASLAAADGRFKIALLHASVPAHSQDEGEYFPLPTQKDFEKKINGKSIELLNKSIPGGIMGGYIKDKFPIYYVNDRMLDYLGYQNIEEFSKDNDGCILNCMHCEDAQRVDRIVTPILEAGGEYEVQYRMRKKDGGYIWVNDIGKKVMAESGEAVCISTIRDITQEVEAEIELSMKEEQFRMAAMQSNSIIFQYDLTHQRIYATEEIAQRFGIAAVQEDVPYGAVKKGIIAPGSVDEYIRIHEAMLSGEKQARGIVTLVDASGLCGEYELTFTAVELPYGKPERAIGIYRNVSAQMEEKRKNIEIARQKQRYEELFHSAVCGIVQYQVLDNAGNLVMKNANPEAIRIFGCSEQEFWSRETWNLKELTCESEKETLWQEISELKKPGDQFAFEYQFRQVNGTLLWILGKVSVLETIDNQIVYQSVFMDIDSRKKAESENRKLFEQVAASNELLRLALENTTTSEFYYYPKTKTTIHSEHTCKCYRCDETYENMPYSFGEDFVAEECKEDFYRMYDQINQGADTASCIFQSKDRNVWCRVFLSAIQKDADGPSFVVGIIEDISKEKNVEIENIELQAISDFVMNHDYEYFCIVDIKKKHYAMRYSDQYQTHFIPQSGSIEEGILGQREFFVYEEDRERYVQEVNLDVFLSHLKNENSSYQIYYRSNEASPRHKVMRVCYFKGNMDMLLITQQDINDTVLREEQSKQALKEAFESANHANQAKSEFLSRMSHDIRTPMNAIVGMTAIAGAHINNQEKVLDCLRKITTSSKHLLNLINEVLDMSKIETGKIDLSMDEFNLSEVVQTLFTMMKPSVDQKHQELKIHVENVQHERVIGDALRLQQVFMNLLSNAVKYTPQKGEITVTIREQPSEIRGYGCYECIFEDNGIGMTKAFMERLFEPFERSDDVRVAKIAGTGLGLAITRNIIRMMYGDIKVESELNRGSRFTVELNLKLQEDAGVDTQELNDLPVLVVDDDRYACESTCTVLNELGMKSTWVLSGAQAVECVERAHQEKKDFYAVVIDWKMPDMDGVETTRQIRRSVGPDIPIIILSAYDWSDIEMEAREAGVNAFISKPLFKSRLTWILKRFAGEQDENDDCLPEDLSALHLENSRILLVEDNELNMEIAKELIGQTGVSIDTAWNGEEAVNCFANSQKGCYDLILMDIQMPVMNGYDAAKAIRGLKREDAQTVPIVAMTANAFAQDARNCHMAGMNGHVAKPIDMKELIDVLQRWLKNTQ